MPRSFGTEKPSVLEPKTYALSPENGGPVSPTRSLRLHRVAAFVLLGGIAVVAQTAGVSSRRSAKPSAAEESARALFVRSDLEQEEAKARLHCRQERRNGNLDEGAKRAAVKAEDDARNVGADNGCD